MFIRKKKIPGRLGQSYYYYYLVESRFEAGRKKRLEIYLGREPIITLEKVLEKGLDIGELRRVSELRIKGLKEQERSVLDQELEWKGRGRPLFLRYLPFLNAELNEENWQRILVEAFNPAAGDVIRAQEEMVQDLIMMNFPFISFDMQEYGGDDGKPTYLGMKKLQEDIRAVLLKLIEGKDTRSALIEAQNELNKREIRPQVQWVNAGETLISCSAAIGFDTGLWYSLGQFLEDPNWKGKIGRCPECSNFFEKIRSDRKWCSDRCKKRAWDREHRSTTTRLDK